MKNYDGYDRKDRAWDLCKFLFWLAIDLFMIALGAKSYKGFFH